MTISVDVQWREQYVSHALNRKFAGVIPTGIYRGFEAVSFTDGTVLVGKAGQESIAVMETNGYSVTVRLDGSESVTVTDESPYVVLDVNYAIGVQTKGQVKSVAAPEPHHLVICKGEKVVSESGAQTWIVTEEEKQQASWYDSNLDEAVVAQMASAQVETMVKQLEIHERLFALENKE